MERINRQFAPDSGYPVIKVGEVKITSGCIEVGDPLCYMNSKYSITLEQTIAPGTYPVCLAVNEHPVFGFKFLTAKMDITGRKAVSCQLAMPQGYTPEDRDKPGVFAMFGVDTGLACICDHEVSVCYDAFLKKWHQENPDKNHYDDYFQEIMRAYALKETKYQRPDGDYLEWELPADIGAGNMVWFSSGFGDGAYSPYWGLDENGEAACLFIPFIDPDAFDVPMPKIKPPKKFFLSREQIQPLIDTDQFGIATDRIVVDGGKVGYMIRECPNKDHPQDSGWMFYEGTEGDEYMEDVDNLGVYSLNTLANYDQDIIPLLEAPVGTAYYRGRDGKFHVDEEE